MMNIDELNGTLAERVEQIKMFLERPKILRQIIYYDEFGRINDIQFYRACSISPNIIKCLTAYNDKLNHFTNSNYSSIAKRLFEEKIDDPEPSTIMQIINCYYG